MIKLIGCFLIAAAGFAVGCFKTQRLSARRDFYERLCVFLSLLETQIRYDGGDIYALVSRCSTAAELSFEPDKNLPFDVAWVKLIDEIPKNNGMNNSDKELLSEFGSALGTTDIEGQLKHIELYRGIFRASLEESKNDVAQKSRIYRSLGLFAGISAALIIL